MNSYTVKFSPNTIPLSGQWNSPIWQTADVLTIGSFRPESSKHRPLALVKSLYDDASVHVLFKVADRFVRCTRTGYQGEVWKDSCVEWFVKPKTDAGYFNFEVNCGGALHVSYVENPERIDKKLKKSTPLPAEIGKGIAIYHSLPAVVDPEIAGPIEWAIELKVPFRVLESFVGPLGNPDNQQWRANFNKCADESSHPHWATWSPVTELNFHRPWEFGEIRFERPPQT